MGADTRKVGMVRKTERFSVEWEDEYEAVPLDASRREDIARLYRRTSAPLYGKPDGGDWAACLHDVDRYLDYHRPNPLYPLFLRGSTLVYERGSGELVAVCLMAGTETEGHIFNVFVDPGHRRRGLATNMIRRALTVYADTHAHVDLEAWVGGQGKPLYEKLGFVVTGPA